jgi:hypothetical protein
MELSVTQWLEQIGLSEYKEPFSRFESVNAILELSDDDLQTLIPDKKHRKKLLTYIKKLKGMLSLFIKKNTLISFSLMRNLDEKRGKKDKSRKGMSTSPSSSVVATQSQFSKSAPTLPNLEDESLPETVTSLIGIHL